ncbi:hypothetical protein ANCDUO_07831 [Ancylostoma duodenale]|uniref:Uncharacterized protein n=1 Tax=Ancylostoma duodenale TaxID=51022 RepID=A0A0C2GXP4_9BILA|nr:hypothetical protein ANCDUO_07831 [Ancylostoma duodenale]
MEVFKRFFKNDEAVGKKGIVLVLSQSEKVGHSPELWSNLWKGVKLCEKLPFMNDLKIENFNNADETKRHIPSLQVSCLPPVIVEISFVTL